MTDARLPEELISRFRDEATDRLARIDAAWALLVRGEADDEVAADLLRDIHTLRGDAKVVGFGDVSLLSRRLEDLFHAAKARRYHVHEDVSDVVRRGIMIAAKLVLGEDAAEMPELMKQLDDVTSEWLRRPSEAPHAFPTPNTSKRPRLRTTPPRGDASSAQRLATATTSLYVEHLRHKGEWRERLRAIWQSLVLGVEDSHREPLEPIVDAHIASAKDLAIDLAKRVSFDLAGDDIALGPETTEVIEAILHHCLRNAVEHGIEPPVERTRAGKEVRGRVVTRLARTGSGIEISIEDDGAGIDIDRVRTRAVLRGYMSKDVAPHATDAEVIECLFAAGFSAGEQAGRGIGLDVAHGIVTRRGGAIRLASTRGQGTRIHAVVPDARERFHVLVFESAFANVRFAVPATLGLRRIEEKPTHMLENVFGMAVERSETCVSLLVVGLEGDERIVVAAGGRPYKRAALRRCITPDTDLAEIVWIDGEEALLLRPGLLARP